MKKLTVILCVVFSIIFLAVGIFVGMQIQKKNSIETSYSKKEAEKILRDYKTSEDHLINKAQEASKKLNEAQANEENLAKEMEAMAMQAFNSQFTPYISSNTSGSQVRALVSSIKANNASNSEHQVILEPSDIASKLAVSKKYTLEASYDNDGYINKISIKEN